MAGIVVPYDQVLDVLQESHRKGTGSAIVISAGLPSAAWTTGVICRGNWVPLPAPQACASAAPTAWGSRMSSTTSGPSSSRGASGLTGPIGLLCQSGATAFGPFLVRAVENGIGFSYINSTGNENKQSRVSATPSLESFKSRRQHARQVVGTRLPFWKAMSAISAGSQ